LGGNLLPSYLLGWSSGSPSRSPRITLLHSFSASLHWQRSNPYRIISHICPLATMYNDHSLRAFSSAHIITDDSKFGDR